MSTRTFELIFKIIWVIALLVAVYIFCWFTFFLFTIGNIGSNSFTIANLIIPNLLTILLLFLYTKELLIGYRPKSKSVNLKSFALLFILISTITIFQLPQFEFLYKAFETHEWQIIFTFILTLTSYIGLIANRVFRFRT